MEIHLQPKQELFLESEADIVIGGGAAGGGKSYALTVEPTRHYKVDGFSSVLFRRSFPEIIRMGGVWDEAMKLYPLPYLYGVPNLTKLEFKVRNARFGFGYLNNEETLISWKSAQIPLIMFDQLETFTERQFFYMLSRNRSSCGVPSYVRATANPEPNWLANFLGWWIADDGYANMDRVGKVRAFIRLNEDIIWRDTKKEIIEEFSYLNPKPEPKTVTFIPFTIYDNKVLMEKDPGYLANLKALPYVDRERLLGDEIRGGNWKVKPAAGKVFHRDWFEVVDAIPEGGIISRYFDFAGTAKKYIKDDPDFTTGVLMLYDGHYYYVIDLFHKQLAASVIDRMTDEVFIKDAEEQIKAGRRYIARWEIEPGSASLRDNASRIKRLAGIDARGISKRVDKISDWQPLSAQAEGGFIKILRGNWNDAFLNEMHGVPDLPHDDIADATTGAFKSLLMASSVRVASSRQG